MSKERRQQKKAEKAKAKAKIRTTKFKQEQAAKSALRKKLAKAIKLMQDGVQVPDLSDEEYAYWLCHGANYMVSNEETGEWTPLFERIYEGELPEPEMVAQQVMARFQTELMNEEGLPPAVQAVVAWTLTDKNRIRVYKFEAERRVKAAQPDLDPAAVTKLAAQPHNPIVWGLLSKVKQEAILASVHGSDQLA